ncbi:hypothetical protein BCR44DRAFT_1443510 [Catenaria anguillulae PL171]|uniref:Uncharacterized protein n=1 Tax=Catenaria anguillulae PL171 TaxID=765915 RepID=A0A1Y2HAB1_9FUNG|nr:hypothetical protein BCR44DRAFT_1443510 [Catenaria anguillulae PL171]
MLASRRSDAGRRRIGIKGRENSSWQVGKSLVSAAEASERGGGRWRRPALGASAGGDRCAVPGRFGRRGNRNVNGS